MTWRDISTAPRDGTEVLVAMPSGALTVARWQVDRRYTAGGVWYHAPFALPQPTHWMPLPDPPETTTEAERIAVMDGK